MSITSFGECFHRALHACVLRSASLLVPRDQRAEWQREWRGELWHVRQACASWSSASGGNERRATAFCLGAFQDALCLRRAGWHLRSPFAPFEGTPRQCLLALTAMLIVGYAIALWLPGVRAERALWPRKVNSNLVMIEQPDSDGDSRPTISPNRFRSWAASRQRYFDGLAFYRLQSEPVQAESIANGATINTAWRIARASSNLLSLLGLPLKFPGGGMNAGTDTPQVILSERLWKKQFGADAHIAGVTVRIGGVVAQVAGVVPDESVELPGRVDAWMLRGDADRDGASSGYVVAHLTAIGQAQMWARSVRIGAGGADDTDEDLLGISLEERTPPPEAFYLFAVFLALLSLPAITSVSLGEDSSNPREISWSRKFVRMTFLSTKMALWLLIVYFASLDLAYGCTLLSRDQAIFVQLLSTFVLCLFGLRWILKDQRQRCPVCMHCVTHPAHVGQASRTFLDWNGTEMMCTGGHTLLHVPDSPTSWFGTQRWLYLDTSWGFLFAGSTRPIP